jgi:hypothetical protein
MATFIFAASQARSIYQYKRLKIKVLKCNADIFFNRHCLSKKFIPNYVNIKVPITSPAAHKTKHRIQTTRIIRRNQVLIQEKR